MFKIAKMLIIFLPMIFEANGRDYDRAYGVKTLFCVLRRALLNVWRNWSPANANRVVGKKRLSHETLAHRACRWFTSTPELVCGGNPHGMQTHIFGELLFEMHTG